jgi:transposase
MSDVKSYPLDHHGIVAGICDELQIVDRINKRIGSSDNRRIIQPGVSAKAMIINGLGFSNRQLYLTPQFFDSKPVEALFGADIKAEDLNEHTLGKALDEIYAYGPTKLFGEIAFEIAHEKKLFGKTAKLDSTSFSVQGEYPNQNDNSTTVPEVSQHIEDPDKNTEETESKDRKPIQVTHGYSKDKRPDLKQVMLSMVVNGPADLPLWFQGLDGNSSDKSTFHETIKTVEKFRSQLALGDPFTWIADSALYSKEAILSIKDYTWLTRVPETLKECQSEIDKPYNKEDWTQYENGYSFREVTSQYGDIDQRWLIVRSEQAKAREQHTLESTISKEEEKAKKDCWHLKKKVFKCAKDAEEYVEVIQKKYKYHIVESKVIEKLNYKTKGRPKNGELPEVVGYTIEATVTLDSDKKEKMLNRKGQFVLATNELNVETMSSVMILENYKDQQSVERGFRFLKDPYFMADTLFLKNPERIEALMVIMCLSLLVYNFSQHKIRQALKDQGKTLPNQKKKEIQTPTMRWIFQIMEGIGLVEIYDSNTNMTQKIVTNLDAVRTKIIRLCGSDVMKIYKVDS